ncbi:hypothetical protein CCR97_13665 [Rhodoplanes elegans]|nr:hypothetical protein [Rhodoplanes elegans]
MPAVGLSLLRRRGGAERDGAPRPCGLQFAVAPLEFARLTLDQLVGVMAPLFRMALGRAIETIVDAVLSALPCLS